MIPSPGEKKASVKMVAFNVPAMFTDPDFMSRTPVLQRKLKICGVLMKTEISHSRNKVYITCVQTDAVKTQHVF